jgi:RHS repeat-associated protein
MDDDYYPFGLTMAGISSKAAGKLENKYRFNDGTELENKEFSDGGGLELYSTEFRKYDPQIGRFTQIDELSMLDFGSSPYSFANNNPILLNDPLGLLSDSAHPQELAPVTVTAKKPLDTKNGQVLPGRSIFWDYMEGQRNWTGHVKDGDGYRKQLYAVDERGYLTGKVGMIQFAINPILDRNPVVTARQLINIKNFLKGRYAIYRGIKGGLPYFGKARGGLNFRYSLFQQEKLGAQVIEGLDNIPNNAIALGVEQLVIDLNGGINNLGGKTANINNATIKEIYINEARYWLDSNIPNWESVLKF